MLEIKGFSKVYKGRTKRAVDDLSLEVKAGDIFGFIGHNGAGKTTTLRACAGILPFDTGEITLDGVSVRSNPVEYKQRVAYIPDNPDIYEYMSARQYLNFICDMYGVSLQVRQERIAMYAGILELEPRLDEFVGGYSHGMKQKLAIIAALAHEPSLLILDEPFVGLDPVAALAIKNIMKDMCRKGAAIFFSTHVLEVAEKLCSKIAIIKNGRLIACGDTAQITGDSSLEAVFMELIDHE